MHYGWHNDNEGCYFARLPDLKTENETAHKMQRHGTKQEKSGIELQVIKHGTAGPDNIAKFHPDIRFETTEHIGLFENDLPNKKNKNKNNNNKMSSDMGSVTHHKNFLNDKTFHSYILCEKAGLSPITRRAQTVVGDGKRLLTVACDDWLHGVIHVDW